MEIIKLLARITTDCECDTVGLNTKKDLEELLKHTIPDEEYEVIYEGQEYQKGLVKMRYACISVSINGVVYSLYNKYYKVEEKRI